MAPKRKSEGAAKSGGKASKQTQLNFAKKPSPAAKQRTPSEAARPAAGGARPAPQQAAAELVLEERAVLPVLSRAATHSLDQVAAEYKTAWADKCAQLGVSGRGLAARDEVDLDGIGAFVGVGCSLLWGGRGGVLVPSLRLQLVLWAGQACSVV